MRIAVLSLVLLASCATTPESQRWAMIEGCWIDGSDMPPPTSMTWRRDPARPDVLRGEWRVEIQGDVDAADFELSPNGDAIEVCVTAQGGQTECFPAVFGRANEADAAREAYVFYADQDEIEFGSTGGNAPFFWGRRGACAS